MNSWIAISPDEHANKYWKVREDFSNCSTQQVVEIFTTELSIALHHYTLGFVSLGESFQLVALVGIDGKRNLYVDHKDRWMCEYVPASLRCYPFILADNPEKEGESVLCIEAGSLSDDTKDFRLFDLEGNKHVSLEEALNFLTQCHQNRTTTQATCDAITASGILEPWPLNVSGTDGQNIFSIEGLHRVNEAKFNSLEESALTNLRNAGAFPVIFGQLFSMTQLKQLVRRADHRAGQNLKT